MSGGGDRQLLPTAWGECGRRPRLRAVPLEAAPTWPQSQGMGACRMRWPCCKPVTDGPYSSARPLLILGATLGTLIAGPKSWALAESPWNCNFAPCIAGSTC
jgi:hypothetical protein